MPSHDRRSGGDPAHRQEPELPSEWLPGQPPEQWTNHRIRDWPGETVPQRQQRRAQQDQWRRDGHQQQVFRHVGRQPLRIKRRNRRGHRDPDQEQPDETTSQVPGVNRVA